jgi:hypothetical protein
MQNNYQLVFLLRFHIDQVMNDVHFIILLSHIQHLKPFLFFMAKLSDSLQVKQ